MLLTRGIIHQFYSLSTYMLDAVDGKTTDGFSITYAPETSPGAGETDYLYWSHTSMATPADGTEYGVAATGENVLSGLPSGSVIILRVFRINESEEVIATSNEDYCTTFPTAMNPNPPTLTEDWGAGVWDRWHPAANGMWLRTIPTRMSDGVLGDFLRFDPQGNYHNFTLISKVSFHPRYALSVECDVRFNTVVPVGGYFSIALYNGEERYSGFYEGLGYSITNPRDSGDPASPAWGSPTADVKRTYRYEWDGVDTIEIYLDGVLKQTITCVDQWFGPIHLWVTGFFLPTAGTFDLGEIRVVSQCPKSFYGFYGYSASQMWDFYHASIAAQMSGAEFSYWNPGGFSIEDVDDWATVQEGQAEAPKTGTFLVISPTMDLAGKEPDTLELLGHYTAGNSVTAKLLTAGGSPISDDYLPGNAAGLDCGTLVITGEYPDETPIAESQAVPVSVALVADDSLRLGIYGENVNSTDYNYPPTFSGFILTYGPDTAAPTTTCDRDSGAYPVDTVVTLTPSVDPSVPVSTFYRINGGEWIEYTEPVAITEAITFEFYSVDAEANEETPQSRSYTISVSTHVIKTIDGTTSGTIKKIDGSLGGTIKAYFAGSWI